MSLTTALPRFVKLECGYQSYEWGKPGRESVVYQLEKEGRKDNNLDPNIPYAELWMGTHINMPSFTINQNNKLKLSEMISQNPIQFLGKAKDNFQMDGSLPYLFKVLSINKALSIQAHPDKALAEKLHAKAPHIYKDDNYKPEMAIAITRFEGLCNFASKKKILKNLNNCPELKALFDEKLLEEFESNTEDLEVKRLLQKLFSDLLFTPTETITKTIQNLIQRIQQQKHKHTRDELMLRLNSQFPNDIGVLVSNFLNYVVLEPGDSLLMEPNEPHAYISGECVECMANSDNVVRVGLTPKYKDVDTLIDLYKTQYKEFNCWRLQVSGQVDSTATLIVDSPLIVCVLDGTGFLKRDGESVELFPGSIYFISAYTAFHFASKNFLTLVMCGSQVSQEDLKLV